jgi:O-antigen ligase
MPDILEARSGDLGRRAGVAPLETAAFVSLLLFAASLQVSIAAANILLALTALLWLGLVFVNRERIEVPRMFWPLAAYAGMTLVSTMFSADPVVSFRDDKQLLLFAIVPIAYRLLRGPRAQTAVEVVITVGAISAAIGVIQFFILKYGDAGIRPSGVLSMYMTYSGQLMLVACVAAARAMFHHGDRTWSVIVLPTLLGALATTLTRNAWIGVCAGIGLLLVIRRDFRLFAVVAVAAAAFFAFAPSQITERMFSIFQFRNQAGEGAAMIASVESNRDRIAMLKAGVNMVKDHPLTGVGPDMVIQVYPAYRDESAVNQLASHLHNVPMQIAAERGLPALAIWLWFILTLVRDFLRQRKDALHAFLPNAALACVVAMVAAGLFEHNFGDSEFLMLFLLLMTLPYAARRPGPSEARA